MTKKIVNSDLLITEIIKGIEEVKGENISIIDLREIENTVCDYFILCDGTSNTQVSAIAASVQKVVSKSIKDKPWHVEGEANAEWILMDYVMLLFMFSKNTYDNFIVLRNFGAMELSQTLKVLINKPQMLNLTYEKRKFK